MGNKISKLEVMLLKSILTQQGKLKKALKDLYVHQKFLIKHATITNKQFDRIYSVCLNSDKACKDLLSKTGNLVSICQSRLKDSLLSSRPDDDEETKKILDETSNLLINLPREMLNDTLKILSDNASTQTYAKAKAIIDGVDWVKTAVLDNVQFSGLLTKIIDTITYFDSQAALNQFLTSPIKSSSLEVMLERANHKIMIAMSTNSFVLNVYKSTHPDRFPENDE